MLKFLGFLALLWLIGVPMGAIELVFWISVVAVGLYTAFVVLVLVAGSERE